MKLGKLSLIGFDLRVKMLTKLNAWMVPAGEIPELKFDLLSLAVLKPVFCLPKSPKNSRFRKLYFQSENLESLQVH